MVLYYHFISCIRSKLKMVGKFHVIKSESPVTCMIKKIYISCGKCKYIWCIIRNFHFIIFIIFYNFSKINLGLGSLSTITTHG